MRWSIGWICGQQKGQYFRTGPDLHFLWWRGQDLNLRPSGYEFYLSGLGGPIPSFVVALIWPFTWGFIEDTCPTQDQRFSGSSPNSRDGLGMNLLLSQLASQRSVLLVGKWILYNFGTQPDVEDPSTRVTTVPPITRLIRFTGSLHQQGVPTTLLRT